MSHSNLIYALDPSYYTNSDVFLRERRTLLSHTWQYAGHASQLARSGDSFTFRIAGESVFCIRTNEGDYRAFQNSCPHSAHELVFGSENCEAIVCPYDGRTYDLNGRQLSTGSKSPAATGLEVSGMGLTPVRLENFHGFLFANLDLQAKSMDQWFPSVREELLDYVPDIEKLKPYLPFSWVEQCNWKVAIENYSECYHCRYNHKALSDGMIVPDSYDIQPQGYCLRHTAKCQNLDRMNYPADLTVRNSDKYSSWFLWPMFTFQVFPGNILNTYCWREVDKSQVEVLRSWYTIDGKESSVIRDLSKLDHETTIIEDIRLVESVQRGLQSRGYRPGPLVLDPNFGLNSEHSIRTLQEWMIEAIT